MSETPPEVFTVAEVAALLKVSEATVYRIKVQLSGFHVGTRGEGRGRLRFTRAAIESYMEAQRCRPLGPPEPLWKGTPTLADARGMRALAARRIHERKVVKS